MSRAAEERFEREFAAQQERDARNFVKGAKVYRANYDHIQEGVVVEVSRCDDPECRYGGKPTGKYPYYAAQFRSEWVAQTYSWKFHADRRGAVDDLIERLENGAADHERAAKKDRDRVARIRSGEEKP